MEIQLKNLKNLRACLVCSMIKTFNLFLRDGCDNCDFLKMKNNSPAIFRCTSSQFEGPISMEFLHMWLDRLDKVKPRTTFMLHWEFFHGFSKGVYARSVSGGLPINLVIELKAKYDKDRERIFKLMNAELEYRAKRTNQTGIDLKQCESKSEQ